VELLTDMLAGDWAWHVKECPSSTDPHNDCDCGFDHWHDRSVAVTTRPTLKETV